MNKPGLDPGGLGHRIPARLSGRSHIDKDVELDKCKSGCSFDEDSNNKGTILYVNCMQQCSR